MAGTAAEGTPKATDRGAGAILIIGDVLALAILGGISYLMMRPRSDRTGRLAGPRPGLEITQTRPCLGPERSGRR